MTLHDNSWHYMTLHYITLHYITLHYIALHYITLHYITLHYIHTYIYTYIYIYKHVYTWNRPLAQGSLTLATYTSPKNGKRGSKSSQRWPQFHEGIQGVFHGDIHDKSGQIVMETMITDLWIFVPFWHSYRNPQMNWIYGHVPVRSSETVWFVVEISWYGGFHRWGIPNSWMVYNGKSCKKWMIWGYPFFTKPKHISIHQLSPTHNCGRST